MAIVRINILFAVMLKVVLIDNFFVTVLQMIFRFIIWLNDLLKFFSTDVDLKNVESVLSVS